MSGSFKKHLVWAALFTIVFFLLAGLQLRSPRDGAPLVLDQAEVHNIAWNLIHGRGYSFDWDDRGWRALYHAHSRPSPLLDMIMCRTGSHPTMSRPPLMPLLVAVAIKIYPAHPFLAWRLVDVAFFSAAICLLTMAVQSAFGNVAAIAVLLIGLLDPLRAAYVPGWWTEGLAFDGVAVMIWLMVCGRERLGRSTIIVSGIVLGLLCLDRSFFIVLLPVLAWLLAIVPKDNSIGHRTKIAAIILGIALLVQAPWWVRNIHLAGQMLPLGTQGGFNLPDEYSDHALATRGAWDGDGIGWVWTTRPGASADEIAGRFPPSVAQMRPAHPRAGSALYATMCLSLSSEIAVCNLGTHAAIAWIKTHPRELPKLFVMKIATQLAYNRWWMLCLGIAGTVGLILNRRRELQWALVILIAIYLIGIGLTHTMPERFLVPILPPLYALAACGVGPLFSRNSPSALI